MKLSAAGRRGYRRFFTITGPSEPLRPHAEEHRSAPPHIAFHNHGCAAAQTSLRSLRKLDCVASRGMRPPRSGPPHPSRRRSASAAPPQDEAEHGAVARLRIHVAAVDRDGLAGDEIAVRRGEKYQRAEEVLRMLVALQRARLHGAVAGGAHVARILAEHGVAQGEAGSESVDADAVRAELARERPRERHDAALAGDVVQHPGDATKG